MTLRNSIMRVSAAVFRRMPPSVTACALANPGLAGPMLRQALNLPQRPGALVMTPLPFGEVRAALAEIGREDDCVQLVPGHAWINSIRDFNRDSRAVAESLAARAPECALDAMDQRLLLGACIAAKMAGVGRIEGVAAVNEGLSVLLELVRAIGGRHKNTEFRDALESFAAAHRFGVLEAWEHQALREFVAAGVCGVALTRFVESVLSIRAFLAPFLEGRAARFFLYQDDNEFSFEQLWDCGRIAVADPSLSPFAVGILRNLFERCRATRAKRVFFDGKEIRAIEASRPVFLLMARGGSS